MLTALMAIKPQLLSAHIKHILLATGQIRTTSVVVTIVIDEDAGDVCSSTHQAQ
jgi:hypothetical protein